MATDARNIIMGPARIYIGGTAPTAPAGLTPLKVNTSGVPSTGGTEVGLTSGPAVFTFKQDMKKIMSQQGMAPVAVVPVSEESSLKFSVLEVDLSRLTDLMNGSQFTADSSSTPLSERLTAGGSISLTTKVVTLVAEQQDQTTGTKLYHAICLYKAYNEAETAITFDRENETVIEVTMSALADTTRVTKDQVFQYFRQKPA